MFIPIRPIMFPAMLVLTMARPSSSDVIEYENGASWQAAVDSYTTINFTDQIPGTLLTEQYSELGIHFVDGNDTVYPGPTIFPIDLCADIRMTVHKSSPA